MSEREGIDKFREGQFSPMEGDEKTEEELKEATRKLHEKRSGREEDGSFKIDETEGAEEEKTEKV